MSTWPPDASLFASPSSWMALGAGVCWPEGARETGLDGPALLTGRPPKKELRGETRPGDAGPGVEEGETILLAMSEAPVMPEAERRWV